MFYRITIFLSILTLSVIFLTGCGDVEAVQVSDDGTIDIVLDEWNITPKNIKVKKGQTVTFNVKNEGETNHNYTIQTLKGTSNIARRGVSEKLIVTFEKTRKYKVHCSIKGHAAKGQVGQIIVEE